MANKKIRAPQLVAMPPRQMAARASVLLLVAVSLSLVVMTSVGSPATSRLRSSLLDILAPVVVVASAPLNAVADIGDWFRDMARLRADNIALKNANIQLLQWQARAKDMEAENASLRSLMNVVASKKSHYITARIVSDMGGPFVRSALLSGGGEDGIKKDQAVINERGLVGRVVDVGSGSSRVLLLSDINSRVPVIGEESREKTILVGNNGEQPTLSYVAANSSLKVGERIITSGDGGVFPKGIAVGVVTNIDNNIVRVQPFVDPSSVEYVSVVDYSL